MAGLVRPYTFCVGESGVGTPLLRAYLWIDEVREGGGDIYGFAVRTQVIDRTVEEGFPSLRGTYMMVSGGKLIAQLATRSELIGGPSLSLKMELDGWDGGGKASYSYMFGSDHGDFDGPVTPGPCG